MAPLAATVAATLAMGVGVALAKAGRERRAERQRRREREFRLQPGERLAAGMRRIALGQAELAIELMEGRDGALQENAVHETRKALKRLRAVVRVIEQELGDREFSRENAALRDIGRRLAGARDSEVLLGTLERLIKRHPRKLGRRAGVVKLRKQLESENELMERRTLGEAAARAEVLAELRAFRDRAQHWQLPDSQGSRLIEPGLERIYRQGRRRYGRVRRGKGDRSRAMHEWRKRVKDLRYVAELLQRRRPAAGEDGIAAIGAKRRRRAVERAGGREAARLKKLARRADDLGELLGEDHDLALFTELLLASGGRGRRGPAPGPELRVPRRTRKLLLKLIDRRRRELRRRALRAGERLYGRSPARFMRAIRRAYAGGERQLS